MGYWIGYGLVDNTQRINGVIYGLTRIIYIYIYIIYIYICILSLPRTLYKCTED